MRIMLACNAGMSTSLVVAKMQDAAKAQGKDYKIWAVEQGEIQNELGNFDVLLLGPQAVSYTHLRKIACTSCCSSHWMGAFRTATLTKVSSVST